MFSDVDRLAGGLLSNGGYNGIYQFIIESEEPLYFYIVYKDGLQAVKEGIANKNDVVISTTAKNLKDLITGELGSFFALLSGKIKIKGDLVLAKRIISLLRKYKPL